MDLSAVILAGGQSRRMGRDKAFLEFEGMSLLERALALLRALGVQDIMISGRWDQDYTKFHCRVLHDLEPGTGPLGGIERALWHARSGLVLVLAVDMARMTEICLRRLLGRSDRLTGALARVKSQLEPLAAIYPARCHVVAAERLRRHQLEVREFAADCVRERAMRVVSMPERYAECFANWNTPEDTGLTMGGSASFV